MTPDGRAAAQPRPGTSLARVLVVVGEGVMVLALLAVWLFADQMRATQSLVVLFLYSFPSAFLIGFVPHEPALLYFGQFHPALTVALVAGVGTTLAEGLNYSFLSFFQDMGIFERARRKAPVARIIGLFERSPFLAIVVAGFTPVPFFPIRFLVVMARYPVARYLLGVFVSRTPRFVVLAAIGYHFRLPGWVLVALFVAMVVAPYVRWPGSGRPGASAGEP